VEDQRTGECLVQKQAEALQPIASITKLMTAMVVLDANMNLQESLTIVSEDVDTFATAALACLLIPASHAEMPATALMASRTAPLMLWGGRIRAVSALSLLP